MAGQIDQEQLTLGGQQGYDGLPSSAAEPERVEQEERRASADAVVGEAHDIIYARRRHRD
jgi:hypothetical protein